MCVFCNLPKQAILAENEFAVVIEDKFPKTPGHSLIIPKRHCEKFDDLTDAELLAMGDLLKLRQKQLGGDDFNIQINLGKIAGQTVPHLHMHLLPRRRGDGLTALGDKPGAIKNGIH